MNADKRGSDLLSMVIHHGGDVTVNTRPEGLSGDLMLDVAALAIASAVRMIEKTWLAAGHGMASATDAGQCAINRAGILLRQTTEILDGHIEVRT